LRNLNISTFLAGGMLLLSQKPGGAEPSPGGVVPPSPVPPEEEPPEELLVDPLEDPLDDPLDDPLEPLLEEPLELPLDEDPPADESGWFPPGEPLPFAPEHAAPRGASAAAPEATIRAGSRNT
jgi:hypothetical protein